MGGRTFVHSRRASNLRCILVCGGFVGQSNHPKWSTWSEGRLKLPEDDAELQHTWDRLIPNHLGSANHYARTLAALVSHSEFGFLRKREERFQTTCGYCQFVCAPEQKRRDRLYKTLSAAD